jgi:hypothetical protein
MRTLPILFKRKCPQNKARCPAAKKATLVSDTKLLETRVLKKRWITDRKLYHSSLFRAFHTGVKDDFGLLGPDAERVSTFNGSPSLAHLPSDTAPSPGRPEPWTSQSRDISSCLTKCKVVIWKPGTTPVEKLKDDWIQTHHVKVHKHTPEGNYIKLIPLRRIGIPKNKKVNSRT